MQAQYSTPTYQACALLSALPLPIWSTDARTSATLLRCRTSLERRRAHVLSELSHAGLPGLRLPRQLRAVHALGWVSSSRLVGCARAVWPAEGGFGCLRGAA